MDSNFRKVKLFNETFGVNTPSRPWTDVVKENPNLVKLRLALIEEEFLELKEAVKDNNFIEIVDALTDLLYVVYGAGAAFGVDLDKAFTIVHESNMSKLCNNESLAQKTVEHYNQTDEYDTPEYKLSDCGNYWIVYNKSSGKILKSIRYKRVNFFLEDLKIRQKEESNFPSSRDSEEEAWKNYYEKMKECKSVTKYQL